ncbi:MAG TPA: DUF2226 domain-containing protein [Methanothermococcus okinawensis]|uniref:DUF2226 domain-containing protein n=1 Tax=Methanothermococcus okinawensis TaxID=155863 RepID=A0A832ZK22_9EURY|nr:DUF2226 domain-containing protein [Methanococcaceae archaeon]HIP84876.1 DUF2226 domain-containing protein [Methanothermococcus okinawensis]HIP90881.1 DUF2226 domain-containing protein [Methanothermococcus okinawensis]
MGEVVSSISDIDLRSVLKELYKGCIYFLFKEKEDVRDVHIFTVKDGEIVSNIYTDGELWSVCGDAEVAYEILQDTDKKVVLYLVEGEKVVGQLFISREVIKIGGETKEMDKVLRENKEILKVCCRDIYLNTSYIRYVQRITKDKIKDFERYLEGDKYYLVHINLSVLNVNRNGYVIYKGKKPIMAAYEDNYGILCGNIAYKKIKKLMEKGVSVIDIYQCKEDFVKTLLERYPEMKIEQEEREKDTSQGTTVDTEDIPGDEENLPSREKLLKKFNLKEPDESWVESLLKEAYAPSLEELLHLKKKIEEEIVKRCKGIKGVKDVKASLEISWEDGVYIIEGEVTVERRKLFGVPLERVELDGIKREIDNTIKSYIPTPCSSKIFINLL